MKSYETIFFQATVAPSFLQNLTCICVNLPMSLRCFDCIIYLLCCWFKLIFLLKVEWGIQASPFRCDCWVFIQVETILAKSLEIQNEYRYRVGNALKVKHLIKSWTLLDFGTTMAGQDNVAYETKKSADMKNTATTLYVQYGELRVTWCMTQYRRGVNIVSLWNRLLVHSINTGRLISEKNIMLGMEI